MFGRTGAWNWQDAVRLCLENSKHASFVVEKLWSYFIPVPPSGSERSALERTYTQGGYAIRPLVEAILMHPQLIAGPRMVKPPVVFLAGMLRHLRRPIDTGAWTWLADGMGQRLFRPPNVAGWDDDRWLDTSTWRAPLGDGELRDQPLRARRRRVRRLRPHRDAGGRPHQRPRLLGKPATDTRGPRGAPELRERPAYRHPSRTGSSARTAASARTPCGI